MKFISVYNEYIEVKSYLLKLATIKTINYRVKRYILPYFKDMNIEDIDKKTYLKWKETINKLDLSDIYKNTIHQENAKIFNYAIDNGYININIPNILGGFKYHKKQYYKLWDYKDFNKFISVVDNKTYKGLFTVLFTTGIRLGEALALTWEDFNKLEIFINKMISKYEIDGNKAITAPKTKNSIRVIHLDETTRKTLLNIKKEQIKEEVYFDKAFIFGCTSPLARTTVKRKKDYYCKKAGVKNISIHSFRHSHATLLLYENIPIIDISRRLGHSSIAVTMETYLHYIKNDEEDIIKCLDKGIKKLPISNPTTDYKKGVIK